MHKIFKFFFILQLSILNCSETGIVTLHLPLEEDITNFDEILLIEAIRKHRYDFVKRLLKKKDINLNFQDENGETPLIHASRCKDYRFTQLLISKNVNPQLVNKYNENATSVAFVNKNIITVGLLLDYEVNFSNKTIEPEKSFNKFIIYFDGQNEEEIKKNKENFMEMNFFKEKSSIFKKNKSLNTDDVIYTDLTDNTLKIELKNAINSSTLNNKIPNLRKFKINIIEIIYDE